MKNIKQGTKGMRMCMYEYVLYKTLNSCTFKDYKVSLLGHFMQCTLPRLQTKTRWWLIIVFSE